RRRALFVRRTACRKIDTASSLHPWGDREERPVEHGGHRALDGAVAPDVDRAFGPLTDWWPPAEHQRLPRTARRGPSLEIACQKLCRRVAAARTGRHRKRSITTLTLGGAHAYDDDPSTWHATARARSWQY